MNELTLPIYFLNFFIILIYLQCIGNKISWFKIIFSKLNYKFGLGSCLLILEVSKC